MVILPPRPRFLPAFTLIEMLLVVVVLAVIATLAAPVVGSVLRGLEMNQARQVLHQHLASARQTAIARNRRVEVRFYKFAKPDSGDDRQVFAALQSFLIDEQSQGSPLKSATQLPSSVLMNERAVNSSLLDLPDKTDWDPATDPQAELPGVGTDYQVKAFQFRPDGSTNLDPTRNWYVTVHAAQAGAEATQTPPNFATIQVDPVSGSVRSYYP